MNAPNILIRKFQDVGLQVNLKQEGFYQAEVLRANGKVDIYPIEKNAINPTARDNFLRINNSAGTASLVNANGGRALDLLFNWGTAVTMVVGGSNLGPTAYDQATGWTVARDEVVREFLMSTTTYAPIGNSATIDPTTGNQVWTARMVFGAAPKAMTIREAAIGGSMLWRASGTNPASRWSHKVLSSPIVLDTGDVLTMSYTLVTPTLAVTAQTISLAAQNGMNLSGQLKLVGTIDNMQGGSLLGTNGQMTGGSTSNNQSATQGGALYPSWPAWGLSTDSTFSAFGANPAATWSNSGLANTNAYSPYTAGTYNRTISGQWNPGARTFRSIYLKQGTNVLGAGYQLLLDAEQTQAADKTLVVSLNFAI